MEFAFLASLRTAKQQQFIQRKSQAHLCRPAGLSISEKPKITQILPNILFTISLLYCSSLPWKCLMYPWRLCRERTLFSFKWTHCNKIMTLYWIHWVILQSKFKTKEMMFLNWLHKRKTARPLSHYIRTEITIANISCIVIFTLYFQIPFLWFANASIL